MSGARDRLARRGGGADASGSQGALGATRGVPGPGLAPRRRGEAREATDALWDDLEERIGEVPSPREALDASGVTMLHSLSGGAIPMHAAVGVVATVQTWARRDGSGAGLASTMERSWRSLEDLLRDAGGAGGAPAPDARAVRRAVARAVVR